MPNLSTIGGQNVGSIGYGLMGLTSRQSSPSEEQSFAAMRAALESGCNLWNGGIFYGPPTNNSLTLLSKYYAKYPEDAEKVVLNIKGGFNTTGGVKGMAPDCSPENLRYEVETCLKTLHGQGKIDMFEPARRDPNVPLKESLGTLADMVKEGKIGGVALSEVSAATIKEAAAITKIVAVEVELSLWQTEPLSNGIAEVCADLGIAIIAYSPIGKGMLTGQVKSFDDIPEGDIRRMVPRFQPENFEVNIKLIRALEELAKKKNCTPAQLALGWLLSLSKQPNMPTIIPIPGATTAERVKENAGAVDLTDEEMKEIAEILTSNQVLGDRYPPALMKYTNT